MDDELEAIAKTITCPECGAQPGQNCHENNFWHTQTHTQRHTTSQEVPF